MTNSLDLLQTFPAVIMDAIKWLGGGSLTPQATGSLGSLTGISG
ncbi:hypothetical protein [Prescottella agglutinans]